MRKAVIATPAMGYLFMPAIARQKKTTGKISTGDAPLNSEASIIITNFSSRKITSG